MFRDVNVQLLNIHMLKYVLYTTIITHPLYEKAKANSVSIHNFDI